MRVIATRKQRGIGATVLTLISAILLTSCSPATEDQSAPRDWVSFGPFFERPAKKAAREALSGPSEIRLASGDTARLDAEDLLGSGPKLPDRESYIITAESYSYTMSVDTPVLVGLIQTKRKVHYRGYSKSEYATFVIAISAEKTPKELTRTRIFRGPKHEASLAARSDLGVVAYLIEGELNTDAPQDSRVIGVDAIRGTEVWAKEHGYPVYGEGYAAFYVAPSPDICASEIVNYEVASGIVTNTESFPNTDSDSGGICRTANADEAIREEQGR